MTSSSSGVSNWRLLALMLRGRRARVAGLGVVLAVASVLPLAGPQLLRAFIDRAVAGHGLATLAGIAGAYVAMALAAQALTVAATHGAARLAWRAANDLRRSLTRHVLDLDLSFHGRHPPGELIERVDGDVTAMSAFLSSFVVRVVGSLITLVGVVVLVGREDWRVGAGMAVLMTAGLLVINRFRDAAVPHAAAERAAEARLYGEVEERLDGGEDLRANGGGPHALRRFLQVTASVHETGQAAGSATARVWIATWTVFAVVSVLSLAAGAWLFQAGAVSLGTAYLLFRYTEVLRQPLGFLADELEKVQDAVAGVARIQQLLAERPSVTQPDGPRVPLPDGPLDVDLDRVAFAYDDGVPVLRDVSLRLPPGTVLGVVGRTGSGKTTLARLLLRLADPTAGSVRLGGVDLREAAIADLRDRVGLVTQDVQLFDASVRENLTLFGALPATDERLTGILTDLELGGWLRGLPEGLDTRLGPGGAGASAAGLSAGEAQLLAFARVFLRDPGVVILDEPASRIDPVSEERIEHAVTKLLAGRTAVMIAHRLGTLDRADEILVLEGGQVAEHGPRGALTADPGSRFARLLATGMEGAHA